MDKKLFLFLFAIVLINLINASEIQTLGTFEQGEEINLLQTCEDSSYSNITRITDSNSNFIIRGSYPMEKLGDDYNYTFNETLDLGQYIVYGNCNEEGEYVAWVYDFWITPNGELQTTATGILYGIVLFVLLFILGVLIYGFIKSEDIWKGVAFLGFSYLVLIAISFIAWDMSANFITSTSFIVEFLRILFIVLIIGFFPVLISSFAYGFWMMMNVDEIKRLQEKGYSIEEAEKKSKRKGGFFKK